MDSDSTHDGKIFLLNLLMSNMVLYNSLGAIDEGSISRLAMICREAEFMKQGLTHTKFMWVLRDFSLEMTDKNGTLLTPDEYL